MNRGGSNKTLIILMIVLLVISTIHNLGMSSQMNNLRSDYSRLQNSLQSGISDMQYEMQNEYREIEELLKKQQSLFTETSVDLKLQGRQIAVTMQGVPKEIGSAEKLVAKIIADGQVYERETDENGRAVIVIEMAEIVKPMFILKSGGGLKQEALDELYTGEMFTAATFSEWSRKTSNSEDGSLLSIWVTANENPLPFTADDIETAQFILTNRDISDRRISDRGDGSSSATLAPAEGITDVSRLQGDRIDAVKLPGEGKFIAGYSGDFSKYAKKADGLLYEIYFTLTTKDGVRYVTSYPLASFRYSKDGGNESHGGELLRPIFN